jgi:hypothetical protein
MKKLPAECASLYSLIKVVALAGIMITVDDALKLT